MKKKIFIISILLFFVAVPSFVFAINLGNNLTKGAAESAGYSAATETTFSETLGTVIKMALSVVGVIFTILMVYAGYLWMTARGEDSQVEKARNIITQSIIGLVIAVGAYSITAFVVPKLLEKTTGRTDNSCSTILESCNSGCGEPGVPDNIPCFEGCVTSYNTCVGAEEEPDS